MLYFPPKETRISLACSEEITLQILSACGDISINEYMDAAHTIYQSSIRRLQNLHESKVLHIAGWVPTRTKEPTPRYAIGRHPDAPKVDMAKARALAALAEHGPLTALQYSKMAGIKRRTAIDHLEQLHVVRKCHIHAYALACGHFVPLYAIGNAPDAVKPEPFHEGIVNLIKEHGTLNGRQYAKLANLALPTAYRRLTGLHGAGKTHIASWERSPGGLSIPNYAAGPGEDAEPPAAYTSCEKMRRHRAGLVEGSHLPKPPPLKVLDPLMAAIMGVRGIGRQLRNNDKPSNEAIRRAA